MKRRIALTLLALTLAVLFAMAPGRCGVAAEGFFSDLPAPDVQGTWQVEYDDRIDVEVTIGGAAYIGFIDGTYGTVAFTHDGSPFDLDLDCDDPLITCPSELFPAEVEFEQRHMADQPHQLHMTVNDQECDGEWRLPVEADGECGGDTGLDCAEQLCDGDIIEVGKTTVGSISNPDPPSPLPGSTPRYAMGVVLAGGIAIPTANCILVAGSYADADIVYDGVYDPEENTMDAHQFADGVITVVYRGACFWGAAYAEATGLALLGAEIRLTTGFTATKVSSPWW